MAKIIISGVSGGIGLAVVRYLLTSGEHCILGISRGNCPAVLAGFAPHDSLPGYEHRQMDITHAADIEKLAGHLSESGFRPDILINNAGMMLNKPFAQTGPDEFDQVIGVNLKAPFMLMQHLAPLMTHQGHIVNITSMGGVMGSAKFPGLSIYSASKGGLSILTEVLAEELKELGIHVNALALGSVQTEMLNEAFPGYKAPVTAEEMAEFIGNFALTGHRYFNGKVLPVAVSTP